MLRSAFGTRLALKRLGFVFVVMAENGKAA